MTEKEAYIAFNLTDKIGSVGVGRLAAQYGGSVAAAWEAYANKFAYNGAPVDVDAEMAKAAANATKILTPADQEYPKQLLAAEGHPLCLYVRGSVEVLSRQAIAIVGTRRPTPYGLDQAYRFGRDLAAAGWSVVSGLALGIDAEAHRGALAAAGGATVGVIGSALNRFYPEKNMPLAREIIAKGGAVVSEFPFGRPPDQKTFPQRNHVVAGLAHGVLAIEAPHKSGTLITTTIAAELGRTVFALPGRVDSVASAGCLDLLRSGAVLVRCPEDVLSEFGSLFPRTPKEVKTVSEDILKVQKTLYSAEERAILHLLSSEGLSLDELVRKTGLESAKVNSAAMGLVMKQAARFLPGYKIALPRQ